MEMDSNSTRGGVVLFYNVHSCSTFWSVIESLLSPHRDDICLQGVWPMSWPLGSSRRLRPFGCTGVDHNFPRPALGPCPRGAC